MDIVTYSDVFYDDVYSYSDAWLIVYWLMMQLLYDCNIYTWHYYDESVVNVTWYQKWDVEMSILCKPPELLSFTGNVKQNWREFAEQLQWSLEGTESTEKGDKVKIGIMLSCAGKEAREIYTTLP